MAPFICKRLGTARVGHETLDGVKLPGFKCSGQLPQSHFPFCEGYLEDVQGAWRRAWPLLRVQEKSADLFDGATSCDLGIQI